jgi:hypothetical protein
MRTTREMMTFDLPFSLGGAERQYPAGTYTIETDEVLVEGLSFLAYRRVATTIYLPLSHSAAGSMQAVAITPQELEATRRS